PTSLHWDVIDEWVVVSDKDAMQMARRLSKEEGLFVGGSTGVNVVAALDVARRSDDPTALVVTVLADTGERYLSKVYNEEWLRENQLIDDSRPTVARLVAAKTGDAPPLIHVAPEASVRQALNLMTTYNVSQLPVLEDNDGVGAVSEQALMARAIGQPKILGGAVGLTPPAGDALAEREQRMLSEGLAALEVVRNAEVLFLAVHGGTLEGGTLQAVLDVIGVPYTGSGPLASALAMDKDLSKRL